MTQVLKFTPVDTGKMTEIPPDAPAGEWRAILSTEKGATREDGYPYILLSATLKEARTEGNESFEGAKVKKFLMFYPQTHTRARMSKLDMKALCDALSIDEPDTSSLKNGSFDSLEPFIESLDGLDTTVYTTTYRTAKGEWRVDFRFTPPGASLKSNAASDDDDAPKAPKSKKH